ncbi:MAG: RHS repeat-associated core domain-containing protein, partial [Terriglobales bacterium]
GKAVAAIASEYQWTNQQRDANGTDHFAVRTYSGDLARWLSPDPAALAAVDPNNPQTWDRYGYVNDDPLAAVDPLGLTVCKQADGSFISTDGECPSGSKLVQVDTTVVVFADPPSTDHSLIWSFITDSLLQPLHRPDGSGGGPGVSAGPGVSSDAPNNRPSRPGFFSCTFSGKVSLVWGETALDAVGIIPGGNDVVHGIQLGAGVIGAGVSVFGDATGAGMSAGGLGLTFADKAGASVTVHGTELIPIAGNIISAGAALHDVFGGEGMIAAYRSCMSGTN